MDTIEVYYIAQPPPPHGLKRYAATAPVTKVRKGTFVFASFKEADVQAVSKNRPLYRAELPTDFVSINPFYDGRGRMYLLREHASGWTLLSEQARADLRRVAAMEEKLGRLGTDVTARRTRVLSVLRQLQANKR